MRPLLLIRADAGPQIGFGHVARSLALAEAWTARGGSATFLTRAPTRELRTKLEQREIAVLAALGGEDGDLATIRSAVERIAGETCVRPWVLLDGYHFDAALQAQVRELGSMVVVIDDSCALPFYAADVVINPNVGAERLDYPSRPETLQLLGSRFCLIRSAIACGAAPAAPHLPVARKLLVTMGGADPQNVTERVVRALRSARHEYIREMEVVIVLGPFNRHAEAVARTVGDAETFHIVRDPSDLPELMRWADVAISAAGGMSWELACHGVPTLLVRLADNQDAVAAPMRAAGAAVDLGWHAELTESAITEALVAVAGDRRAREALAHNARQLIDGRGPDRVVDAMLALGSDRIGAAAVTIREATMGDLHPIWRLANDPAVRASSFGREVISLPDHTRWLNHQLASPESLLLLLEAGGALVAQVRYTSRDAEWVEVHFSVAPAFRGKGMGTLALTATRERASRVLGFRRVRGLVMRGNTPSLRAFQRAGYREVAQETYRGQPCTVFEFDMSTVARGS